MSADQIVELVMIVVAVCAVLYAAEQKTNLVSERIDRILAQERLVTVTKRAEAAERILGETSTRPAGQQLFDQAQFGSAPPAPATSRAYEIAVDAALEQAEPTPHIRRVQ